MEVAVTVTALLVTVVAPVALILAELTAVAPLAVMPVGNFTLSCNWPVEPAGKGFTKLHLAVRVDVVKVAAVVWALPTMLTSAELPDRAAGNTSVTVAAAQDEVMLAH